MLLSELRFASALSYSVRGDSVDAESSRNWRSRLKRERSVGDPPRPFSRFFAERIRGRLDETPFSDVLTPTATLVPVPASGLLQPHSLWVPFELATALVDVGLGSCVEACLKRIEAVPKSAWQSPEGRPSAQRHYESMRVQTLMYAPTEVVLVDDVVTRGATFLAAASRVHDAFPNARVTAFAAMRAMSSPNEFSALFDPCLGTISLKDDGGTLRRP